MNRASLPKVGRINPPPPLLKLNTSPLAQSISPNTNYKNYRSNRHRTMSSSPPTQPKIHILGLGNVGRLFSHALATSPNPPTITLLFHRPSLLQEWTDASKKISITTQDTTSTSSNYAVETTDNSQEKPPIENLILTTKTLKTTEALLSIKPRLSKSSTILFTQNGMGTIEEINSLIFPDPSTRPTYLSSIVSHGIYSLSPFHSVHAGVANITIGPNSPTSSPSPQSSTLIQTLLQSPLLNTTSVPSQTLTILRLQKLTINAMINPLATLFSTQNGQLFPHPPILSLMLHLLHETSQVLLSLPEISLSDQSTKDKFSEKELLAIVLHLADVTKTNTSSMLQDARAGRETEIEYINGWIARKGREAGVDVRWNERLVELIKEKRIITADEIDSVFNF